MAVGAVHTLPRLREFALAEPEQARAFLAEVATGLKESGLATAAASIDQVLASTDDLVGRIEALGLIFPENESGWGDLQTRRRGSVGWSTSEPTPPVQHLEGTVRLVDGKLSLTTPKGTTYALAESVHNGKHVPIPRAWMQGLIDDGPITVHGHLGTDGKTFNVQSFALDVGGAFKAVTFGRVHIEAGAVFVSSPAGDVEVVDKTLAAKLRQMPKLGVILPGAPVLVDGRLRYEANPTELYALGGFRGPPQPAADGRVVAIADMAVGAFDDKPVDLPAELAERTNQRDRIWLRGDFTVGPNGEVTGFVASYVSKKTDDWHAQMAPSIGEADPVQAAVMLAG